MFDLVGQPSLLWRRHISSRMRMVFAAIVVASQAGSHLVAAEPQPLRTAKDALGDWSTDAPGVRRKITPADLPAPNPRESVDNGPRLVERPRDAQLHVPDGFRIEQVASGLRDPRFLLTAPNGD